MSKKEQRSLVEAINTIRDSQQQTDNEQWKRNLEALISAQPGVRGPVECTDLRRPEKGASSGNIMFSVTADSGKGPEKKPLALRYNLGTGIMGPYHANIPSQFKIQKALYAAGKKVAKPLWLDSMGEFLDHPGFVMEFVNGRVPPQNIFHAGVIAEATADQRHEMIMKCLRFLAETHELDWQASGLGYLKHRAEGNTWAQKELNWYVTACNMLLPPDISAKARGWYEWIVAHQPEESSCVFCQGDAQEGNYMYGETSHELVAVFDWEMSGLCPRETDLAYLDVAHQNFKQGEQIDGVPSIDELAEEYHRVSGYRPQNLDFYRIWALAKIAMIFRLGIRNMPLELQEASRPSWGWFEDRLFELIGK
ncbi:MAG: phosphotransferase family protein [Actinobacteria bacterium]|nr:phosphotransferase family protein [Actinomycetota bacterium]